MTNERLIARSGTDEWFLARRKGISATAVAKAAASEKAFERTLNELINPEEIPDNAYMKFGRNWEEWIVNNLPSEFGIIHNDWLIAKDTLADAWQLATPDGMNDDWSIIAEVKTTGKQWESINQIPIQYRRQVQWQMNVTGAKQCVFGFLLRMETPSGFEPAYFQPKHFIIERDDQMIEQLIEVAKQLQMNLIYNDKLRKAKDVNF